MGGRPRDFEKGENSFKGFSAHQLMCSILAAQ